MYCRICGDEPKEKHDGWEVEMRIKTRRDGTIRIEAIGRRELIRPGEYFDNEPDDIRLMDPVEWWGRPIQEGDEGCLDVTENLSPNVIRRGGPTEYGVRLVPDPEGLCGNTNHEIKRLHGWRGTSNDISREAWGWRRVESIRARPRGIGYVVILSADLMPNDK